MNEFTISCLTKWTDIIDDRCYPLIIQKSLFISIFLQHTLLYDSIILQFNKQLITSYKELSKSVALQQHPPPPHFHRLLILSFFKEMRQQFWRREDISFDFTFLFKLIAIVCACIIILYRIQIKYKRKDVMHNATVEIGKHGSEMIYIFRTNNTSICLFILFT